MSSNSADVLKHINVSSFTKYYSSKKHSTDAE